MNKYSLNGEKIDSIELKCLVVSRGVKVENSVYKKFSSNYRLGKNPLMCNCFFLSDNTIVQLSDMSFHLEYLSGILSWNNLKLLKYASDLTTPFSIKMDGENAALFYNDEKLDIISFPPKNDFYRQKTSNNLPFVGNAVLQGVDWVAFQCLWSCEYAAAGKGCEFCFSGGDFETLAKKKKPIPKGVPAEDVAEIVEYAINKCGVSNIQITGGSTFDENKEFSYIKSYLQAINKKCGEIKGEILLYITPPKNTNIIDEYFKLGASKIACSLEVWDENLAKTVTPGKIEFTTRKRHLDALEYISKTYGTAKAFSNFIIGAEPFESLKEGAEYLASRGIIPTASIWMPMGRPVNGTMKAPEVDYYRKVKQLFASLYQKYNLEPTECCGLNVCMERDIWNFSKSI